MFLYETFNGPIIYNKQSCIYIKFAFNQFEKLYLDHSKVAFLLSEKQVKHKKITVFSQQI